MIRKSSDTDIIGKKTRETVREPRNESVSGSTKSLNHLDYSASRNI